MHRRTKIIRVFVSSTFEDLKLERDALQQGAFRNLREYCREKGWQFQAVDLRWGINNEATIDQRTMEICLREIERCQEQSPRPNFIVLLGERYGWRPLPDRILHSVYLEMVKEMPSDLVPRFNQWYEKDENQLPEPVWRIKAREGRYIDYREFDVEVQRPLVEFFTKWSIKNLPDPDLPKNSNDPRALQRLRMERSATEQEIHAGAFRVEDASEHVHTFFRQMPDCPAENATYRDSDTGPVERLFRNLKKFLPPENVHPFSAAWDKTKNQPGTAHLKALSDEVEKRLKKIIDNEIEKYKKTDEDQIEQDAHEAFAKERTFGFAGREKDIGAICNYAGSNANTPFVVWGESGTGKSALLAMTAFQLQKTMSNANIIARFIGVTGKSSAGHTLLYDLCRNLCALYGGDLAQIPQDPVKLEVVFPEYLLKATADHPLVLFIDALDQFRDSDPARQLNWLPGFLPPTVKIVLSTLKGECFERLKQRNDPAPQFHEITPLAAVDGRRALEAWLKRENRTLQDHQKEQIIKDFEHAGCAPLYLHLVFEQAQHWKSFERRQRLGRNIPEMIEDFYEILSRPEAHGSIVEKTLTAIRCAKQGLSDDEILGVLSADNDFWSSFGIQNFHTSDAGGKKDAVIRLVPPVLWIRLYHDLEYYLTRRNAPGGEVITFYHSQLSEVVDAMYLARSGFKQKRHKDLADFFAAKQWFLRKIPFRIPNRRKLDELPWQYLKSENPIALKEVLGNLDLFNQYIFDNKKYELLGYWLSLGDLQNMIDVYMQSLSIYQEKEQDIKKHAEEFNILGAFFEDAGLFNAAESLYRHALVIREKVFGPEHPDTAQSLNNLAVLLNNKGDYAGAEPLYRRALSIKEKALAPDHPDTATSLNNLALLLNNKGDYTGAEILFRHALAIWEKNLGPDHLFTATNLNNLAVLLKNKGDYSGAEPLYRRALAIIEKVVGPDHPDAASSLNNLAILLDNKGDYAAAEPLYRRALSIRENVFGTEHPDVASSLNNLAVLLKNKGDYTSAEPLYRRSLAIREKTLGSDHPETAQSLNNLAVLLKNKGDYSGAEPLCRRSLAIREKVLGPDHPYTAQSLNHLATLLDTKGDYTSAEPLFHRALAIREKTLGPDHPYTATSIHCLAELL
ncbi:tetratricopeptide repeat protein, partial [bacterium]|nr:tetratricopeptide repeat protein [bacterium]